MSGTPLPREDIEITKGSDGNYLWAPVKCGAVSARDAVAFYWWATLIVGCLLMVALGARAWWLAGAAALFAAWCYWRLAVAARIAATEKRKASRRIVEPAPFAESWPFPWSSMEALLTDGSRIVVESARVHEGRAPAFQALPGPGRGIVKFALQRVTMADRRGPIEAVYVLVPGQDPELVREAMRGGSEVVYAGGLNGRLVWAAEAAMLTKPGALRGIAE